MSRTWGGRPSLPGVRGLEGSLLPAGGKAAAQLGLMASMCQEDKAREWRGSLCQHHSQATRPRAGCPGSPRHPAKAKSSAPLTLAGMASCLLLVPRGQVSLQPPLSFIFSISCLCLPFPCAPYPFWSRPGDGRTPWEETEVGQALRLLLGCRLQGHQR